MFYYHVCLLSLRFISYQATMAKNSIYDMVSLVWRNGIGLSLNETFHVKMTGKPFSCEWFRTKTRFDTDAIDNSEMTYKTRSYT